MKLLGVLGVVPAAIVLLAVIARAGQRPVGSRSGSSRSS
jgi:hypothetical protein